MNDLTTTNENFDRLERFESLSAGTYWSCQVEKSEIPLGMVLLIERIKYADDNMHSVILHGHPRHHFSTKKFTFHVRDFLNEFQFEPNGEAIRAAELSEIQSEINNANQELLKFQTDPDFQKQQVQSLIHNGDEKKSLPTTSNASPAISPNMSAVDALSIISVEGALDSFKATADHHLRVAKAQGTWLENKASGIAKLVSLMTPFYQEQAVAALAKTNDIREHITELMKGIESLDLYTGKDIHIETISKGISAPPEIPLTLVQSRLYAQEELAVWVDVFEDFDYGNRSEFKKALKANPDLVAQIFPTERCVLLMSMRRDSIRYSDAPLTNSRMNAANLESFMLVRDGENIYQVFSPIESHAASMALFPSQGELDSPFRGVDGKSITFEDLRYADRKAGFKDKALHYKRYLILMCGLDSREKLFGHFHNEQAPFALVSLDFQNKYFNFIYDGGDGMLPTSYESRTSINTWIRNMNKYLTRGSHIICEWRKVVNYESAPHLYEKMSGDYSRYKFKKTFTKDAYAITRVIEHKGELIVEAPLYNYYNDDKKPRNYKVKLNSDDTSSFICLDMMKVEDVNYYIYNRSARSSNVNIIRMLKRAAVFLADKVLGDENQFNWIADNVNQNSLIKCTQEHVQQSIQVYKSHEGVLELPSMSDKAAFNAIFDVCYHLANYNSKLRSLIESKLVESGMTPLRLVLSGNGRHYVYAALPESECEDRFEKFNWVRKSEVIISSRGVRLVSGPLVLLKEFIPSEISLHEWDDIKLWVNKSSVFSNAASKQKILNVCDHALEALRELNALRDNDEKLKKFAIQWFSKRNNDSSGRVVESSIVIPIGLHLSDGEVRFICLAVTGANLLNSLFKSSECYSQFVEHYVGCYRNEELARKKLDNLSENWMFCSCPTNAIIVPGINLLNGEGKELRPAYTKSQVVPEAFACMSVSDLMSFMLKAETEERRSDRHKIFFPDSLLGNLIEIDSCTKTKTKLVSELFLAAKVSASLNGETYIIGFICKEETNRKHNAELIRKEFTNELLNSKKSNTMSSSMDDEFFEAESEAVEYINATTSGHTLIAPTELSIGIAALCTKYNAFVKKS